MDVNPNDSTEDLKKQGRALNDMRRYQHDGVTDTEVDAAIGQIMGILNSRNVTLPSNWLDD